MKREIRLLKWIVRDDFNHEFHPLMCEIRKKLKINVSEIILFFILIIYQYTFIFLLLLLLYKLQSNSWFNIVFSIVMFFNIILPVTIARTSVAGINENPIFECLLSSKLDRKKTTKIIIIAELVNFWIHNFSIEAVSICLLWMKYRIVGIGYGIVWVIVVSIIFLKVLIKHSDVYSNTISEKTFMSHLGSLIITGYITYKIFLIFVDTLQKYSINTFLKPQGINLYVKEYLEQILIALRSQLFSTIIGLLILITIFFLLSIVEGKLKNKKLKVVKGLFLEKYIKILQRFTKNFWVKRDIRRIFNILSKLGLNIYMIIVPTGIAFITVANIYYYLNVKQPYIILISLTFILWTSVYQFSNLLVQKIPIFNISSELRNVDLLLMSSKSIEDLIRAKHILLTIFCSPLLIICWMEKVVLLFLGVNITIMLLSMICDIGIYILGIEVALKWTFVLPKFSWENIFLLKQDNFDQQIIQQFLLIPSRLITIYFSISFLVVNAVALSYNKSFIILYYVLNILCMFVFFLVIKRRKQSEISLEY